MQKALDEENNKEVRREFEKLEPKCEQLKIENDKKVTEKRKERFFERMMSSIANVFSNYSKTAQLQQATQLPQVAQLPQFAQLPQADGPSTAAAAMQTVEVKSPSNVEIQPAVPVFQEIPQNGVIDISVHESREESNRERERVSLAYEPSTAVERHIYNNYKLLVLTMSDMLLSSEKEKFKEWARDVFHVHLSTCVYEGFLDLDRKGIISASDLTNLKEFFEKLWRFDLVHLIDCFIQGDYNYLQRSVSSRKNNNPSRNTRTFGFVATPSIANPKRSPAFSLLGGARNSGSSQGDGVEEFMSRSTLGNCRTQNSEGASGKNINRTGLVVHTDGATHAKHGKIKRDRQRLNDKNNRIFNNNNR